MDYGFVRVAAAIPNVEVADCKRNCEIIAEIINEAESKNVEIITFPELSITGYTCGDLFANASLLASAENELKKLIEATAKLDIISIVGMPVEISGSIINTAVIFQKGNILGIVPKTYLPNYKEFQEKRWFASALQINEKETILCGQKANLRSDIIINTGRAKFAVEICEDLWAPISPSTRHALNGADLIFNMSADDEGVGKYEYLKSLIKLQSAKSLCGYVFTSSGFGESSSDLVFTGNSFVCEMGKILAKSKRFSYKSQLVISDIDIERIRSCRRINTTFTESKMIEGYEPLLINAIPTTREYSNLIYPIIDYPFVPKGSELNDRCNEAISIQTAGLAKRLVHTHCKTVTIGISGGLDSTLALLICANTFDKLDIPRENIVGVTMPGFGTTDRTYTNAIKLMEQLGITIREISIKDACIQHFKDINHDIENHNVTYENSQARERTQILMDIANQTGGMVIGTGDLSELALGWATYNGDHMSMYGVNASIPKTLVKHLVKWIAENNSNKEIKETLLDIVDTPISPELIPADNNGNIKQKTEDLVGPYELHDFFLYNFVENQFSPKKIYYLAKHAFGSKFDEETIKYWLKTFVRRFFNQQFKRSCLPDGPKVGLSLSPRGDWRMPSDASSRIWLDECNEL